uniref:MSP domain-containing protein n=1 Tax=Gongylonema pulchrum TaxID=637853 RepID=A0A183DFZ8_9BILA
LKMEPKSLNWNTSGGVQKVYLTNASDERRAIKVKCSDNNLYRVNPVFAFIEPGQVLNVDVVRQNGGAKADKMVFVWSKASDTDHNPQLLFNDVSSYAMSVLPLIVNAPAN